MSLPLKLKLAAALLAGFGGLAMIDVSGGVRSMAYCSPVNGRLPKVVEIPVALTMLSPKVPAPDPVLAATRHWVLGADPTTATLEMAGVPPRPTFTNWKLLT